MKKQKEFGSKDDELEVLEYQAWAILQVPTVAEP